MISPEKDVETGKVTCLRGSNDDEESMFIGSKKGFITKFNHTTKAVKTFRLDHKKDHKVS